MAEKESTAYLKQFFTPELARRFSDELGLTFIIDILKVTDSSIKSLRMMDGQKATFFKVRDGLIRTHREAESQGKVSAWLRDLAALGK
jgi:hypothetical protein